MKAILIIALVAVVLFVAWQFYKKHSGGGNHHL